MDIDTRPGSVWRLKRCLVESSWAALRDNASREEGCYGLNERLERIDGVLVRALAGSSARDRYTATEGPAAGEGKVLKPGEGAAAAGCADLLPRSRVTVVKVVDCAFDASALHHMDPNEGVLQPLSPVRPCI